MNYLLIRGLGRQSGHWSHFKTQLEQQEFSQKVLALDLPGFGTKNTEDSPLSISAITDFVRHEYLKNITAKDGDWTLVGFSLGGMVALDWVDRYSFDFKKIILINTSTANLSPPWKRLKFETYKHFLKMLKTTSQKQRETEILRIICNHSPDSHIEEWTRLAKKYPYKESNVVKQLLAAISFRSANKIKVDGLVLTSKKDRMVSYSCSKKIANHYKWPLKVHPTAGHDLTMDDSEWVVEEIKNNYNSMLQSN